VTINKKLFEKWSKKMTQKGGVNRDLLGRRSLNGLIGKGDTTG
jgi:hypothetical protein